MKKIPLIAYLGIAVFALHISADRIINLQSKNQVYNSTDEIELSEYGLVLGASMRSKHGINRYFKYRMDAAIDLYNAGKIQKIIVSGDNHKMTYNEPRDMANYLIKHGIPAKSIILDYAGFRTFDSVVRAKKVFDCKQVTIISQAFHNKRALFIANAINLKAIGFNAKDVKTTFNFTHFRSYLSNCLAIIDIYVLKTRPKFL